MSELPGMWDESDLRGGEADSAEDLMIVRKLKEENARLRRAIDAVNELICHSSGVAGLHLNGNVAYWDELKRGGRHEGWLSDLSDANDALNKQPGESA